MIENHVDQDIPIIIEGDGILPSLLARSPIQVRATGGRVRAVFVVEPDEVALHANIVARHRWLNGVSDAAVWTEARTKWLYGQWLAQEARRNMLPVVEPRPWSLLVERLVAASRAQKE